MDTIAKLSRYGQQVGSNVRFIGVPKTIDNDLCLTDHTPGYGSAAKYIATILKEVIRDSSVYNIRSVTVAEIMGRHAGWLAGAACLAGGDGWDSAKMPEIAGAAALNNTYFSSLYSPEDSSDINKNFVAAYEKAYGQKPDVFAALSYDSALLVAEAIKNAGSTEPAKISEAMAKINGFSGVSGSVTFDDKHNPVKSAVILEYKDGAQSLKTKINP